MPKSIQSRVPKFLTLAAMAAGLSLAHVGAADAQRVCGKRAQLSKFLSDKYNELPRGLGLGGSGKTIYEVYTSEKGTWTVMMTMTNGTTCIMATGHSWKEDDQVAYLPKT